MSVWSFRSMRSSWQARRVGSSVWRRYGEIPFRASLVALGFIWRDCSPSTCLSLLGNPAGPRPDLPRHHGIGAPPIENRKTGTAKINTVRPPHDSSGTRMPLQSRLTCRSGSPTVDPAIVEVGRRPGNAPNRRPGAGSQRMKPSSSFFAQAMISLFDCPECTLANIVG